VGATCSTIPTATHKRGTGIPGKISELINNVDLPEALHEKKEYSRSKTEKRRNSRENERKNLLERRDSQNMRSSGGKRYSLFASPAQLRMDLEKQILQKKSSQDQPLDSEIPHLITFTDHHCAAGTNRLFIKGASKASNKIYAGENSVSNGRNLEQTKKLLVLP
jgi:hypothetical protein